MDLTRYVPVEDIDLARKALDSPLFHAMLEATWPEETSLAFGDLMALIQGGARVITPPADLCRALQHGELNIDFKEYAQPYDVVGVVVPGGSIGPGRRDLLAIASWVRGTSLTLSVYFGGDEIGLISIRSDGIGEQVIEDVMRIGRYDQGSMEHSRIDDILTIARVVIHLCLLAVERGVRTKPLDARAEKRRRKASRDDRMARLAARDAQEVCIQDLDLIVQAAVPSKREGDESGEFRQPMHRRRGHWKSQAFGPGRSQRRRIFVQSYMVHANDDPDGEVQSILS